MKLCSINYNPIKANGNAEHLNVGTKACVFNKLHVRGSDALATETRLTVRRVFRMCSKTALKISTRAFQGLFVNLHQHRFKYSHQFPVRRKVNHINYIQHMSKILPPVKIILSPCLSSKLLFALIFKILCL